LTLLSFVYRAGQRIAPAQTRSDPTRYAAVSRAAPRGAMRADRDGRQHVRQGGAGACHCGQLRRIRV